jgi:hypothetical protein
MDDGIAVLEYGNDLPSSVCQNQGDRLNATDGNTCPLLQSDVVVHGKTANHCRTPKRAVRALKPDCPSTSAIRNS